MREATAGTPRRGLSAIFRAARVDPRRLLDQSGRNLWLRKLAALAVFQGAYVLSYIYGMGFGHAEASPFWFPDSILLCALLISRRRIWWVLLLSTLPSRLLLALPWHFPLWFLLSAFVNDCGKALLVAWVLRRFLKNPVRFGGLGEYALFCAVAVVLAPTLSAFGGATAWHFLGRPFWPAWKQWFLGDVATHLIVTPAIMYAILGDAPEAWTGLFKRWREAVCILVGLIVTGIGAFRLEPGGYFLSEPACYAPIPFLFWAAVRFGMLGASSAILVVEIFAIVAALNTHTRFAGESGRVLVLRDFLFLGAAPLYLVAILNEQKRRVERSLMESESRFRMIADTAPVMIWTSGTNKLCDFVNRGWLDFSGRALEQEQGNGWADGVHPEDFSTCLRIYYSHFDARKPFEMEYRLRRHDGEYRWILSYGRPRYDSDGTFVGYIGSAIDITERRKQESALQNSEERYREVVECQPELVCRYLPDTNLTFVNEAFCRFFGRKREQVIGKPFPSLMPEKARELVTERIAMAASSKVLCAWECEVPRQGGGIIWQRWVNHPIFGPAGELEEFQCIAQDITDRKRAEELAELLTHAQHEERKRIARDLHDDFNQRVAAHAIALSNLRKYILETRRKSGPLLQRVDKLQKEAVALGEEIRVIAHQLHPTSIERDGLEGALRALCNDFGALGHLRVNLQFDGSTTALPAKVTLCCFRLVQEGLCNVAKHAHASEVTVKVTAAPDRVSLELADNGIGLNGHGTNHEGGLGISSMRERVKLLSGTFRIGKRSPYGTLMTAVLPVASQGQG